MTKLNMSSNPLNHICYVALGANLPYDTQTQPVQTLGRVISNLNNGPLCLTACSEWYESPPWPGGERGEQPVYVNGVLRASTGLTATEVLEYLHSVEREFGRDRALEGRNGARPLDLDLISFNDEVWTGDLVVPHPRMHLRRFVLQPLADIAPDWMHPVLGKDVNQLILELPETEPSLMPVAQ